MCENGGTIVCNCSERILVLEVELAAKEAEISRLKDQLERGTERTSELAKANQGLENANVKIQGQSQSMLKHFACMSHEIRSVYAIKVIWALT
jgi:hypothetical protein